jgi:transcriptional regulator with XRE-family HTH domain
VASTTDPTGTAGTPDPEGVVSGAILRLIRGRLGLSQDQAAESLGVDANTFKSWETGRRPLARVSVQRLRAVMRTLNRLSADPVLLDQLDTAIDVDVVIGQILATGHRPVDHPLGSWVHTRVWHDLLAWAVAGTIPAALRGLNGSIPRPRLAPTDRARLFDSLRVTAEQAGNDPSATLLRRQVAFVASWDSSATGRDWLARQERAELRRLRPVDGWTPAWVAARSIAVARAVQGDPEHLRHFIRTELATDGQEAANLNYWANWCGEDVRPAVSDDFMATGDLGPWRGGVLLCHLAAGLDPATPYVELTIHSVWALLGRRPWLLDDDPNLTTDLRLRIARLLDGSVSLGDQARRELGELRYAAQIRGGPR